MPRPKGKFKTPEELAAMTPEQRQKYNYLHEYYLKKRVPRNNNIHIPSYVERRQQAQDAKLIEYDSFPESMLREWLRTHAKFYGDCRHRCARWGIIGKDLAGFLAGGRPLKLDTLRIISTDTMISLERLLLDHDEARIAAADRKP